MRVQQTWLHSPGSALAVLIATLLLASCDRGLPKPFVQPNVILIVLDTVRSSSLRLLQDPTQSRVLSQLANRALVFERASSTFDYTPPSHHSMFTGYYDGLNTEYDHPDNSLASHLRQLGYLTIGVSANGNLSPQSMNICKPFEIFHSHTDEYEKTESEVRKEHASELLEVQERYDIELSEHNVRNYLADADWVLDRLREALPKKPERPVFIFLNFIDAHDPFVPPAEFYDARSDPRRPDFYSDIRERPIPNWRELGLDDEHLARSEEKLENAVLGARWKLSVDLSSEQLEIYLRRYEATIRYLDSKMAELIELLEQRGVYENSVIFITSDHGEAFGEEDFLTHNLNQRGNHDATMSVPMIIVPQVKILEEPLVIKEPVSIADIKPTIDELLGIDFLADRSGPRYGRSLAAYLGRFSGPPPEPVVIDFVRGEEISTQEKLRQRMRSLGYLQ